MRCLRACLVAAAILLSVAAATSSATAKGGTVFGGGFGFGFGEAKTTRVPACIERFPVFGPPPPPRHGEHADPDDFRHELDRFLRCVHLVFGGIGRLGSSLVGSLQRGNEVRACKLLTRDERSRLGGDSCPASLAGLDRRMRAEREPSFGSFTLSEKPLRGDLELRLVRPFEKIGIRFEVEGGFWRISNIRDLLRQQPPSPRTR